MIDIIRTLSLNDSVMQWWTNSHMIAANLIQDSLLFSSKDDIPEAFADCIEDIRAGADVADGDVDEACRRFSHLGVKHPHENDQRLLTALIVALVNAQRELAVFAKFNDTRVNMGR